MAHQTYGTVADYNDPLQKSRCRVRVITRTDDPAKIPTEDLPWYTMYGNTKNHSLPKIGELVKVYLYDSDIHVGEWERIQKQELTFGDGDYISSRILLNEVLDDFEDTGTVAVSYTKSKGLELNLANSKINIRRDGTVSLYNTNSGKYVHISDESISLGSNTKSKEPATLGQTNVDMLNQINDTIKEFRDNMSSHMDSMRTLALGNPRTAHLAKGFTKTKALIKKLDSQFSKNKTDFEKTKSLVVTLD